MPFIIGLASIGAMVGVVTLSYYAGKKAAERVGLK